MTSLPPAHVRDASGDTLTAAQVTELLARFNAATSDVGLSYVNAERAAIAAVDAAAVRVLFRAGLVARHENPARQSVFYSELDPPTRMVPVTMPPVQTVRDAIVWMETAPTREPAAWRIPHSHRWIVWAVLLAVILAVVVL